MQEGCTGDRGTSLHLYTASLFHRVQERKMNIEDIDDALQQMTRFVVDHPNQPMYTFELPNAKPEQAEMLRLGVQLAYMLKVPVLIKIPDK
jgi:hypothetical protein